MVESRPQYESSYQEVISFLKKMWLHPLLNQKTIAHRTAFKEKFRNFCQVWDIDEKGVIAGPIGSSVWIVNDNGRSDFDFFLFFEEQSAYQKWGELYDTRWKNDRTPEMHSASSREPQWYNHCLVGIAILYLTPDEFLAGNLEMAYSFRLAGQNLPRTGTPNNRDCITYDFGHFYIWWDAYNPDRFQQKLDEKAKEFAIGKNGSPQVLETRYRAAFMKSLKSFSPPPDQVFLDAVNFSHGHLSISSLLHKPPELHPPNRRH